MSNGIISLSKGNASSYGSTKLSDTYNSSVSGGNASGGVGASQNALFNAYNDLANKVTFNVNETYITPRTNHYIRYGKILRICLDATLTSNTTGWHTFVSGLPTVRENQYYKVIIINTSGVFGIRDGLFTQDKFNIYVESFDERSRILVDSLVFVN